MQKQKHKGVSGVVIQATPETPQTRKSVKFSRPPKLEEYAALAELHRANLPAAFALWEHFLEQDELATSKITTQAAAGQSVTQPILKGA